MDLGLAFVHATWKCLKKWHGYLIETLLYFRALQSVAKEQNKISDNRNTWLQSG